MADRPAAKAPAEIADRVERWLFANAGARPLQPAEFNLHKGGGWVRGWRFTAGIAGKEIGLDLVLDDRFPRSRPRIALVEPPPFLSYPHVEEDGAVCSIEAIDELDPDEPLDIIKAALAGAFEILNDGINGRNREDFRREFLSYWGPTATGTKILSLVDPCGPSRRIKAWTGRSGQFVAESRADLSRWLKHRLGAALRADQVCRPAFLLWLSEPLHPEDYPSSAEDMRTLARRLGQAELDALDAFLTIGQSEALILLGAETGDGKCLAAVTFKRPHHNRRSGTRRPGSPKGQGGAQQSAAAEQGALTRHRVARIDPRWVHGRDGNDDLESLLTSHVVMVGCGSLGAPVARLLAQAGVGRIDLIDPEALSAPNTGRHLLGSPWVGFNKATALAAMMQRDLPHLTIFGHAATWQEVARRADSPFAGASLVISTIGSWSHEGELNAWQIANAHPGLILYAWAEPHAAGGHAVLIGNKGECFACGLGRHGEALFTVADFPSAMLRREPACGSYFQPYGASEINLVASVASDLALDALLERAEAGAYRIVSGREAVIAAAGGTWTTGWRAATDGRPSATQIERLWPHNPACPDCQHRRTS